MTLAESINLREKLIANPVPTSEFPLTYHERTGHILPPQNSHIQKAWDELQYYVEEHEMKINFSKTKLMLFNRCKTMDFMPSICSKNGEPLKVVEKNKIVIMWSKTSNTGS